MRMVVASVDTFANIVLRIRFYTQHKVEDHLKSHPSIAVGPTLFTNCIGYTESPSHLN